jgi:hypothetical protein
MCIEGMGENSGKDINRRKPCETTASDRNLVKIQDEKETL